MRRSVLVSEVLISIILLVVSVIHDNTILDITEARLNPDRGSAKFECNGECNYSYLPLVIGLPPPVEVIYSRLSSPKSPPFQIVGEVWNNTDKTVYDVSLTGRVLLNGEPFEIYTGTLALPATFPGDTNLFAIQTDLPFDPLSDYSTYVIVDAWSHKHDPEYLPLTVLSKNFDGSHITGEIRNDNSLRLTNLQAIYDEQGIFFFSYANISKLELDPGESSTYSGWTYLQPFWDGNVWAQGAIAP